MTVGELIKLLKEMPKDARVVVMTDEGMYQALSLDNIYNTEKVVWIG